MTYAREVPLPPENDESITQWLARLQVRPDDSLAQQRLLSRCLDDLVGYVRGQLRNSPKRIADEEDVALEVLAGLFHGIRDARFTKLNDREDLWQVLRMLARRRAVDQLRFDQSPKRRALGESVLATADLSSGDGHPLQQVPDDEVTPALAVQLHEAFCQRLQRLDLPQYGVYQLRQIAIWKLDGETNEEIARRLGCVTRTVERRLDLIRKIWTDEPSRGTAS
jgi:RNA polymerase sigma factor (sigma-70 family)